jgi:5-methylcytosine-specific restriction enzyme B
VSPLPGHGRISWTKNVHPPKLVASLGSLTPGSDTGNDVRAKLRAGASTHELLWDDLVTYDGASTATAVLRDDELLSACRGGRGDALLLTWGALVLADRRMSEAIQALAAPDGRLDSSAIDRRQLQDTLTRIGLPGTDKDTTNLLGLLEDVGLIEPQRVKGSVVGVRRFLPTSHAVPGLVRLLSQRLPLLLAGFSPGGGSGWVDLTIAVGANTWLNLSPREFRDAATPRPPALPRAARGPLPPDLVELDTQLQRNRQIVLQGPPGGGKTHRARRYVTWATAGAPDENRLQTVAESLPAGERAPQLVADEVRRRGCACVWEIVQFHPAYSYSSFVRALVSVPVAGGVSFEPRHRVLSFLAAVAEELANDADPVPAVLVIDEINRGDIPAIFGELLYALEYRGQPVTTPHAVDGRASLVLPSNLFLIGTMNTADRSIAVIDYALRRRFVFVDVPAGPDAIAQASFPGQSKDAALYLFEKVEELLQVTAPSMRVGPSYFLLPKEHGSTDQDLAIELIASRFCYEVMPLLQEYQLEGELEEGQLDHFLSGMGVPSGATQAEATVAVTKRLVKQPWLPSTATATPQIRQSVAAAPTMPTGPGPGI